MHTLYKHYDKDNIPLYIGITEAFYRRTRQHELKAHWWVQVVTIKIQHFATRKELQQAEADAIAREIPIYNTTHSTSPHQAKRTATLWYDEVRPRRMVKITYPED